MSDPDITASPATTIGRYHVVRLIAHGGMGSLYLARDPAIDRLIAIKLLKLGFDDNAARERFAREARATGRLRHPNIVTVFDVGEHDKVPFIAMEYVPGETLAELIRRRAPLSVAERLVILEDLCAGLHFAHAAGIVHRDIKPANVILDVYGTIKILDFGLARAPDSGITKAGDQLGTLNYMSPEQVVGDRLDHRSDVYAVGALAYELMSFEKAFPGTVQDGAMYRILNTRPSRLEIVVPGIDPQISTIVDQALAKEPDRRYQNLEQMREDLAAVRSRLVELAPERDPTLNRTPETIADSAGSGGRNQPLTPTPGRPSRGQPLAGVARHPSSGTPEAIASSAGTLGPISSANVEAGPPPSSSSRGPAIAPVAREGNEILRDTRASSRRRTGLLVLLAATAAGLIVTLAVALSRTARPGPPPPSSGESRLPPVQQAPGLPQTSPTAAGPSQTLPEDRRAIEERLNSIRATARRQITVGQHQQVLDTLSAGLVLDAGDPELNGLIDELMRAARQTTSQARVTAARRGATENSSLEFRDGRTREREADSLVRSGDRAQATRAFWAATELYDRAARVAAQGATAASVPAVPAQLPEIAKAEPSPAPPERQPSVAPPAPHGPDKSPSPPVPVKPELSTPTSVDAVRDGRTGDVAAIQDTLRRYAEAYRSRDIAAVRKVLPSLGPQQLRSLDRDFSDYRSYNVEIGDVRVLVDNDTATAACQVTRSFVTRNGVAGGHTVATIFHLRKVEASWAIERLESR